jgi:NAD(P)-dependent dehydrogenase (short-subunit alcohol dehydrogenase family)
MLLKNKFAVVTGGGRGIGRSIALHFAHEGADVALIGRTRSEIEQTASEIQQQGRDAFAIKADIADEKNVLDAFAEITDRFGRIDILVNNAGIEFKKPFSEMPMDEWDQTMNVNTRGTVLCIKAVLKDMQKRNEGNIINIASGAGLRGLPGSAAYGASKAAVIALTFALADEVLDQGIRVNVICPGPIKTGMLDPDILLKNTSSVLVPENVAGTAIFLASKLSDGITGQVFNVRNTNRW